MRASTDTTKEWAWAGEFADPRGACQTCLRWWTWSCGDIVYGCSSFGGEVKQDNSFYILATVEGMGEALKRLRKDKEEYRQKLYALSDARTTILALAETIK